MVEEGEVVLNQEVVDLPPGFRFHPTDEEIISHYLKEKVFNVRFTAAAIGQADLNKNEPWDLPKIAKMGEKEFYFFCQRDRKYPTGLRTNRATAMGYWKATGKDKEIFKGKGCLVGMKKTLVFYIGRAPKGEKTNWVMHEYRLDGKYSYHNLPKSAMDEWVVCRVFHKTAPTTPTISQLSRIDSIDNIDHFLDFSSLPPLIVPGNLGQPGPNHPTTAPVDNTFLPTQTLDFPYQMALNSRPGSSYGVGLVNNNKGVIKLEHSLVSVSQETGLSTDVNATATPDISSNPITMNLVDNETTTSFYDDLGYLDISWDE